MQEQDRRTCVTLWGDTADFSHALMAMTIGALLLVPGEEVPDVFLAHLSPLEREYVTLTGVYRWDLDGSPAVIGPDGFRRLRGLA